MGCSLYHPLQARLGKERCRAVCTQPVSVRSLLCLISPEPTSQEFKDPSPGLSQIQGCSPQGGQECAEHPGAWDQASLKVCSDGTGPSRLSLSLSLSPNLSPSFREECVRGGCVYGTFPRGSNVYLSPSIGEECVRGGHVYETFPRGSNVCSMGRQASGQKEKVVFSVQHSELC